MGIGTTISAPFALIAKHQSLDDVDVLINVNRKDLAQGKSGNNFGTLINLGSGYNTAQFTVDVPDAPFGYDWGPGTYRLAGGAGKFIVQLQGVEGYFTIAESEQRFVVLGTIILRNTTVSTTNSTQGDRP